MHNNVVESHKHCRTKEARRKRVHLIYIKFEKGITKPYCGTDGEQKISMEMATIRVNGYF